MRKFKSALPRIEKIILAFLIVGCVFFYMKIDSANTILVFATSGLAIILFANAFVPNALFDSEEEANTHGPLRFLDLLALIIVPKVLWIGSGVSMFAIVAYLADFGNKGYIQMGMIGGLSIASCFILLVFAQISGIKKIAELMPVVYRAAALMLIDYYLVFIL